MAYKDIFEAASKNNIEAVKKFIEVDGIQPGNQNREGDTIAHIAAQNDNIEILKYVLEKDPALLTARGQAQSTLLEIAIAINSLSLVKYIVNDCNVDIRQAHCDQPPPDTYVHFAAEMGNLEIFKYFIEEKNVDVNLQNAWKQPPAFAAARESHLNVIKYIVEVRKGDVTTTDSMGRNILCQSAIKSDLTIPKYLLDEKKLNINVNNPFIVQDAVSSTEYLKRNELDIFMKYFVEEKHININAGKDAIPLHRAANAGMLDVVKYLIKHGADINRKDFMGRTPLQVAIDKDVIKYLQEVQRGHRTRRSLLEPPSMLQRDSTICKWIPNLGIQGPQTSIKSTTSNNFNNFLLIANACVGSRFQVDNHVSLSLQDFMGNRVDPVAVDAVNSYM